MFDFVPTGTPVDGMSSMSTSADGLAEVYFNNCKYYWPSLKMLWNPPSKMHWVKALNIIEANYDDFKRRIYASILLVAAQHGQALLAKKHRLAEHATDCFYQPTAQASWEYALGRSLVWVKQEYPKKPPDELLRSKSFRASMSRVRDNPAWLLCQNAEARYRSRYLTKHLRAEESKANAFMRFLYKDWEKQIEELYYVCDLWKGITCEQVLARSLDEEKDCPICRSTLLDLKEACDQPKGLLDGVATNMESKSTMGQVLSKPLRSGRGSNRPKYQAVELQVECEVDQFLLDVMAANNRLRDIGREFCFMAVKLHCTHIFGWFCIQGWFHKGTCPLCRAQFNRSEGCQDRHPTRNENLLPRISNSLDEPVNMDRSGFRSAREETLNEIIVDVNGIEFEPRPGPRSTIGGSHLSPQGQRRRS